MIAVLLALLLSPSVLLANGLYLNAGLGWHGEQSDRLSSDGEPWLNALGIGELGYKYGPYSVYFLHISSVQQSDRGLNMLAIKKRIGGRKSGGCE